MKNQRKVIWIEDNPKFNETEREYMDKYLSSKNMTLIVWQESVEKSDRGNECLKFLKKQMEWAKSSPEEIAGFILDVRIPVDDLNMLGLPVIETTTGLYTGLAVAYYYIINKMNNSPLGNLFAKHHILFFSIAPGLGIEFPWIRQPPCDYIEKGSENWKSELGTWFDNLL